VAQLQDIAKQDESIYVYERLGQSRARGRTAQHIGARPGAEMQV
jgi:hypothetical protein